MPVKRNFFSEICCRGDRNGVMNKAEEWNKKIEGFCKIYNLLKFINLLKFYDLRP